MWINKCWAHASILLINRGRHHASIFEKITHFTNKLALLYGSDYKCMTTFIWNGDYVIPILLLIYSDTSNVFCVVHFIGCIIQLEPLRTALSMSLFLVPFFLSLSCILIFIELFIQFVALFILSIVLHKRYDVPRCTSYAYYLPMLDKNSHWTHWRVRDAFQFNHTWNVTHDRNVV